MSKKNKNKLIAILICLFSMFLHSQVFAADAKTTFLVYIVGSDLESGGNAGTSDIDEMSASEAGAGVNVIITTGGANKEGWKSVKRKKVEHGKVTELADLGETPMCKPETLSDFIIFGVENYPADKYHLILWDHGAGINGYGHDEVHNGLLSISDVKRALETAYSKTKKKFEVIGFDACLMANLETAEAVKPFANFMVASEEIEPGHGWDYASLISAMGKNPEIDGAALGKEIVSGYQNQAHDFAEKIRADGTPYNSEMAVTLSVIDLSKIDGVVSALSDFSKKAAAGISAEGEKGEQAIYAIAEGRSETEDYGNDNSSGRYTDMADLENFMHNNKKEYPAESESVIKAVKSAVVNEAHGKARPNSNGISLYMPHKSMREIKEVQDVMGEYDKLGFCPEYKKFIGIYTGVLDKDQKPPEFEGEQENDKDGVYTTAIDGSDIETAYAVITQADTKEGEMIIMGMEPCEVHEKHLSYKLRGQWLHIEGRLMPVFVEDEEETEEGGKIQELAVPVVLNGENANILIYHDEKSGELDVIGAWPGIDKDEMASREILPVKKGDKITPRFVKFNMKTNAESFVEGESFKIEDDKLTVEMGPLPKGKYLLGFIANDYAQNNNESDLIPINIE